MNTSARPTNSAPSKKKNAATPTNATAKLSAACISFRKVAAALAAATLRKLMHAALSFAVALVGVAAFFFLLGAEFVGLALVFIYIGAVAVLIVFTILLTRRDTGKDHGFNWAGAIIAVTVFGGLMWAILKTQSLVIVAPHTPALTVKRIGVALMTT